MNAAQLIKSPERFIFREIISIAVTTSYGIFSSDNTPYAVSGLLGQCIGL